MINIEKLIKQAALLEAYGEVLKKALVVVIADPNDGFNVSQFKEAVHADLGKMAFFPDAYQEYQEYTVLKRGNITALDKVTSYNTAFHFFNEVIAQISVAEQNEKSYLLNLQRVKVLMATMLVDSISRRLADARDPQLLLKRCLGILPTIELGIRKTVTGNIKDRLPLVIKNLFHCHFLITMGLSGEARAFNSRGRGLFALDSEGAKTVLARYIAMEPQMETGYPLFCQHVLQPGTLQSKLYMLKESVPDKYNELMDDLKNMLEYKAERCSNLIPLLYSDTTIQKEQQNKMNETIFQLMELVDLTPEEEKKFVNKKMPSPVISLADESPFLRRNRLGQ